MAKSADKVMDFVTAEIAKNPKVETSTLFEKAKALDPSIAKLSLRQFNGRYPLQVKRKMAPPKRAGRKKGSTSTRRKGRTGATRAARTDSGTVRDVFLRFASDLSAAEERKDLVKVLAGIDRYVDEAITAAKSARGRR